MRTSKFKENVSIGPERFISEALKPVTATSDTVAMSTGAPGLPREFLWRKETVTVTEVLRTWRETAPCHHGSGENYVRKHWFEVRTAAHGTLRIYFERQARGGRSTRWWLYSILTPA